MNILIDLHVFKLLYEYKGSEVSVDWEANYRAIRFRLNGKVIQDWRPTGLDAERFALLVPVVLMSDGEIDIIDKI